MRKLLTAEQAANLLQVSKQTLMNWERSGKIQTFRIGGIVRYHVDVEPTPKEQHDGKNN